MSKGYKDIKDYTKKDFPEFKKMTDEEFQNYKSFFIFADADKSGEIATSELTTAFRNAGSLVTDKQSEQFITEMDKDGNGMIDFKEFISYMVKADFARGDTAEQELRDAFAKIDKDGSGNLDKEELMWFLNAAAEIDGDKPMTKEEVSSLFDDFDTNKDGVLDIDEFITAFKQQ